MSRGFSLPASLFFLSLFLAAGCNPHLSSLETPDPDVVSAREDYQGEWAEAIGQQQIYRNMDVTEVFLSWGRPQHRFRSGSEEKWIYYFPAEDPDQLGRVVRLFFEEGKLRRWAVDRGFTEFMGQDQADEVSDFQPIPGSRKAGK